MTRIITPTLPAEAKAEYVARVLSAVEKAGVLRDALHTLSDGISTAALDERIDTIEQMQNELLELAMRITLGV